MRPRHTAALGAILGLLVPLVCEAAEVMHPYLWGAWLLWIWPSSIQLIVLNSRDPWFVVVMLFAISIGINMLLYAGVGWLTGFVYSRLRSPK